MDGLFLGRCWCRAMSAVTRSSQAIEYSTQFTCIFTRQYCHKALHVWTTPSELLSSNHADDALPWSDARPLRNPVGLQWRKPVL